MWVFDKTLLEIGVRTALVYLVVLIGIRLSGKREVGQMTPFDLVLLLLIANAVQNAMTGPDTSLTGGWVAAGTLLLLNFLVSMIVWRSRRARRLVEGIPTVLVHHGVILQRNLAREKLTTDDLSLALRGHGIGNMSDVEQAMLEVDGTISVLKKDEMPTVTRPHHRIRFIRKRR